jgi:hypothetical protein
LVRCPGAPDNLWIQHHNGIFRSVDDAATWTDAHCPAPSAFGFAVAVDPVNPEVAWFVPAQADERRVPVDGRLVVTRTEDGGRSYQVLTQGLPQEHAYHLVYRHGLDIDGTGERLAMGSTTGGLWISEDRGESWCEISRDLPPIYCVRFAIA